MLLVVYLLLAYQRLQTRPNAPVAGCRKWNVWERLPPRGIWPHALARAATLPQVTFEVLRSKPNLVPSVDAEVNKAVKDAGVAKKRKRGEE
jgi:hypothetical protein